MTKLRIGLDLDQTVYGFPEFFKAFIEAMYAQGHTLFVTSNHLADKWPSDCAKLAALGIDASMLDPGLMQKGPHDFALDHKKYMAEHCDYVFDDCALHIQPLTATPIFMTPYEKARDKR